MVSPVKITTFASPRDAVATLAARDRTPLAALSRMLDRDERYLGRFVREGRPARLGIEEQRRLAAFFGADPRDFGAIDTAPSARERSLAMDRAKFARLPPDLGQH